MDLLRIEALLKIMSEEAATMLAKNEGLPQLLAQAKIRTAELPDDKAEKAMMNEMLEVLENYLSGGFAADKDTITAITAAAIYLTSKDDAIPDDFPLIGVMDDLLVIEKTYRKYKEELSSGGNGNG